MHDFWALLFVVVFPAAPAPANGVVDLPPAVVQTEPSDDPAASATTTVTTVPMAETTNQGLSAADALSPLPGVFVRETQGPGSYAALSLRGSGPDNVAVVLDDLPLDSASLGFVDLSLAMAESLDRIEVYRGLAPARFPSPLGGVVRLLPPVAGDHLQLKSSAGVGSAHTYQLTAAALGPVAGAGVTTFVGYRKSQGDFRYYSNQGTVYEPDDDIVERRHNNAQDSLQARATVDLPGPNDSTLRLLTSAAMREQGIAGTGQMRTVSAHTRQHEETARLSLRRTRLWEGRFELSAAADGLLSNRRYDDPDDEMNLRIARADARLGQVGSDAELTLLGGLRHESSLFVRIAQHWFQQRSKGPTTTYDPLTLDRRRAQLALGLTHRAEFVDGWILEPAVRVDAGRDVFASSRQAIPTQASPRLGSRLMLAPCTLHISGGRSHRMPSLLERFGDMITSRGTPDLKAESAWSGDLGVTCDVHPVQRLALHAELVGFGAVQRNLIVPVMVSQHWLAAQNLGRTRNRGLEAALGAKMPYGSVDLGYTFLDARDRGDIPSAFNKQLPGFPRHRINARARLGNDTYALTYELSFASHAYLDRANLQQPVPSRWLSNVAAHAAVPTLGLGIDLSVRNLFDALSHDIPLPRDREGTGALADFLGYPIPGRSYFAGITWSMP